MSVNFSQRCERCGAQHPRESTAGLCPACLVRLVTGDGEPAARGDAPEAAATMAAAMPRIGSRIGDYELKAPLGEGGMGVVFRARHIRLKRLVALKMLPFGRFSPDAHQKRFRVEAEAIAQLRHPNIVTIYEIGEHDGQPFLSMEYVDGADLATIMEVRPMSVRDAARLVERVADAIGYAHDHGIAHRDLKPSNILVDADGQPRVTDFGLAKNMMHEADVTMAGQPFGSPNYLPPEQAQGGREINPLASDVYGIGAILYHLLTRRPPFVGVTIAAVLHQLSQDDPLPPRVLNHEVPRDLETICLKCLEKEPMRRYGSAREVAGELTRFLRHEPIRARPIGVPGRVWRWCRRRPALAAMTAATVITLSGGLAASLALWQRAQERAQVATESLLRVELERADDLFERGESPESLARLARLLRAHPMNLVVAQRIVSALTHRNFLLPASPEFENVHDGPISPLALSDDRLVCATEDGRELAVWNTAGGFARATEIALSHPARVAALSADGRRLAVVLRDRTVQFWDIAAPNVSPVRVASGTLVQSPTMIQLDASGSRLIALLAPKGVALVDAGNGRVMKTLPDAHFAELSPDARWFVTVANAEATLWDATTGEPAGRSFRHAYRIETARFSPDSKRLVTASADRSARIWEVDSGRAMGGRLLHQEQVLDAVFSPDGQRVLTQVLSAHAQLWDAVSGLPIGSRFPQWRQLHPALFSPDGLWLVSHFRDRVWLRDAFTGGPVSEPVVAGISAAVRFLADGTRFVTSGFGGRSRLWSVQPGDAAPLTLPHNQRVIAASFSRDGTKVLTCGTDAVAQVWSAAEGRRIGARLAHERRLTCGTFDAAGLLVATGDAGGNVRIWKTDSGEPKTGPLSHHAEITGIAFTPDGRRLVASSSEGAATVWNVTGGARVFELRHSGGIRAIAITPDGRYCATAGDDRAVRLWYLANGELEAVFKHTAPVSGLVFSPDGAKLATGDGGGRIRFWNVFAKMESGESLQHGGSVHSLRFSADGRLLASASNDFTARVWDVAERRPVTGPLAHGSEVVAAWISPDGRHVLTGSADGTARVWNIATGLPVTGALAHGNRVETAEWAPDGRTVLTASWDGAGRVWTIPILREPPAAARWLADVAETFGGLRLADNEVPARVPRERLAELARERPVAGEHRDFVAWAEWLTADRAKRAMSANASLRAADHARTRFDDTKPDRLRRTLRFAPMDATGLARWSTLVQQQSSERNPRKTAEAAFAAELAGKLEAAQREKK